MWPPRVAPSLLAPLYMPLSAASIIINHAEGWEFKVGKTSKEQHQERWMKVIFLKLFLEREKDSEREKRYFDENLIAWLVPRFQIKYTYILYIYYIYVCMYIVSCIAKSWTFIETVDWCFINCLIRIGFIRFLFDKLYTYKNIVQNSPAKKCSELDLVIRVLVWEAEKKVLFYQATNKALSSRPPRA